MHETSQDFKHFDRCHCFLLM